MTTTTDAVEALVHSCEKYNYGKSASKEPRGESIIMADIIEKHLASQGFTITRAEPAPVGFDAAIKQLGEPDVATGHWSLDEGNLRWFVGQCKAEPKPITDEVLWEAVEYFHKRMSGLKKGDTVFLNLESLNIRLLVIEAAIDELSKRRAEPSPKVEMPDGFKYTPAQQAVWDWWCEHQKAPPVCDDLNNLVWQLDKIKSEPAMSEAELELDAKQLAIDCLGQGHFAVEQLKDEAMELAKKYRG